MKYALEAVIWNKYRSKTPRGFYNIIKGHTGVDLNYVNEKLPSPVSGKVVKLVKQSEMGNVLYLKDKEHGYIHVFAHLSQWKVKEGDNVARNQVIAITGNSGGKSTSAHLHYEIISLDKPTNLLDRIMTRSLGGFKGWNIDPIRYLRQLYGKYGLNSKGEN